MSFINFMHSLSLFMLVWKNIHVNTHTHMAEFYKCFWPRNYFYENIYLLIFEAKLVFFEICFRITLIGNPVYYVNS